MIIKLWTYYRRAYVFIEVCDEIYFYIESSINVDIWWRWF